MDVASLDLASVDHVLTTTRAVRKRLDLTRPVAPAILEKCLEIALQAPLGLSGETRHFVVVTDPEPRAAIAALYRQAAAEARSGTKPGDPYLAKLQITDTADPRFAQQQRMFASGAHLVQHLHEVPVLVLACIEGRIEHAGPGAQASLYASIMPAVWSLMLALRARGLGSVLTTRHIHPFEREIAQLLGIPAGITQAALLAVAYFTGTDFKPARRAPVQERTHWNRWDHRGPRQEPMGIPGKAMPPAHQEPA
jgi:nitroreductase